MILEHRSARAKREFRSFRLLESQIELLLPVRGVSNSCCRRYATIRSKSGLDGAVHARRRRFEQRKTAVSSLRPTAKPLASFVACINWCKASQPAFIGQPA